MYELIFDKPVNKWGDSFCKALNVPQSLLALPQTQDHILLLVATHYITQ